MDNGLAKKLGFLLSKLPKKDLKKNIEQAKKILENTDKSDLNKLLNSQEVSNLLGKDKEKINEAINNIDNISDVLESAEIKEELQNIEEKEEN